MGKIKKMRSKNKQSGFGMTEMLIIAGIVAVLLIFLLSKGKTLTTTVDSGKVVDAVNSIEIGVNQMYANAGGDYTNLTNSDIVYLVPQSMVQGTGSSKKVITPWYGDNGTEIKVAPTNANKQFTVTLNDLPTKACQSIGANYLSGVDDAVSAGGSAVTNTSDLNTKCASSDKSTLVLTFH
jgi:type II secretory pathway pseudopilin PulG